MTRRLVLVAAALVGIGLVVAGALAFLRTGDGGGQLQAEPTEATSAETLDEQIARIAATVEDIRELSFDETPEATTVPPDELAQRVADELQAYTPEQAAEDERMLRALGVIGRDTDLRALIIRGYSEQVGGYYDPETGELVVGVEDTGTRLGRLEEIILAHELEHALADEALGLPDLEADDGEEDRALARQALTEGDATVTMQRYVEVGFSIVDQLLLPGELVELTEQLAGMTELPHYVQRSFTFPYEEGAAFVTHLLDTGGWDAVDAAYDQPPTTTAEILFPERYPAPGPSEVGEPVAPGEGVRLVREVAFGAADLLFLFEAPGDDPARALEDPLGAAAAWRGGELHLYAVDDGSAVGIALATDDLATLCPAVADWYDAAHDDDERIETGETTGRWEGGDWNAELRCDGRSVRLGIAPSTALANRLVEG